MSSIVITPLSPVQNIVEVTETVSAISISITEQVIQPTIVISPQSITNYYGGSGEVTAALTGVPAGSNDLGVGFGNVITDNVPIKDALIELEAAIEVNDADITQINADLTTLTNNVNTTVSSLQNQITSNDSDISQLQTDLANIPPPQLTLELDPTETQLFFTDPGVYAVGTDIETVLRDLLIHFQPPVMTLSNWTSGTYEHGYSWSDTDFTVAFSNIGNVNTADTGLATFSDSYIASGTSLTVTAATTQTLSFSRSGNLLVDNGTPAGLAGTLQQRSGAAQLTLSSFTDTQGAAIQNKTISSTVRYRYWVISNTTRIDYGNLNTTNGTALITSSSSLGGSGAGTIESGLLSSIGNLSIVSAGTYDYVYWIYPTAWTVNNINNPLGLPIYTGDQTGSTTAAINYIGTFTLTNVNGADVSMTVLRTKNSGALGSGTYTVS